MHHVYVNKNDPTPSDGETIGTCGHLSGSVWGMLTEGATIQFPDGCTAVRFGACEACVEQWGDGTPCPRFHGVWYKDNLMVVQCHKSRRSGKVYLN
jgi:hypothetical protein